MDMGEMQEPKVVINFNAFHIKITEIVNKMMF